MAILLQDTVQLQTVILPDPAEIQDTMCILLIEHNIRLTCKNIEKLEPVLVIKLVVWTLATFLVNHNAWYHGTVTIDEANLNHLFVDSVEQGVSSAVELCLLCSTDDASVSTSYVDACDNAMDAEPITHLSWRQWDILRVIIHLIVYDQ